MTIPAAVKDLQRLDRQLRGMAPREPRRARPEREPRPLPPYGEWYRTTIPDQWGVPAHIAHICEAVQRLVDGDVQRLCLSMPPGHAKSDTVSRRLPVYWSDKFPGDSVVLTGYSQRFAEKHLSYPARELAREMGILASSATALDEWEFANGTRLVCRGVGSAPTGVNPISLLVCDDPIKSEAEARSEVIRENVWDWWTTSIEQRMWPRTRVIVIATRWHEDDLIGRIQARQPEGWEFVNLPALAGLDDPLGRAEGEALWPEEKPAPFLRSLQAKMGRSFEALFQGNPTPKEGSTFKVGKLRHVDADELPEMAAVCRAWDLAGTEGAGDWTVGAKVGRGVDGLFYVLDVVRGQWDAAQWRAKMRETAEADGKRVTVHLPQDPGQAGKDQARQLVQMLAGYVVKAEPVSGDKGVRADPFAAQMNAGAKGEPGNVRLLRAEWNRAWVDEHRGFPNGRHDDQVDATADAFTEVAPSPTDWSRA